MIEDLNPLLEQLRVLWRLCNDRGWISRQPLGGLWILSLSKPQLVFIVGKLDEAGPRRRGSGWLKQLAI
jgi:hypothetical protein